MSKLVLMDSQALASLRDQIELEYKNDRREMESYSLSLDKDASSKSPAVLYDKLRTAREYTNRSGVLYSKYVKLQVLAKKLLLERTEQRRVQLAVIFREQADVIAKFRSSDEKNRYCESLLRPEDESLFTAAKLFAEEAAGYIQYFKFQYDFYKDLKSDILTQLGIIRTMLMLGELSLVNDLNPSQHEFDPEKDFSSEVIVGEGTVNI